MERGAGVCRDARGPLGYTATPVALAGEDAVVGAEVEVQRDVEVECVELERERRRGTNNLGR